jgi:hypothetical protein
MGLDNLARKAGESAARISRDIVPAVIEGFETQRIPDSAEKVLTPPEAEQFAASLITPENRQKLDEMLGTLPDGTYRARENAGTPEDGNRHVHDFIIKKSGPEAELFYIDPEHSMGKSTNRGSLPRRGDLRPQVNVLYSTKITNGDPVPRFSLLRYRAAAVPQEKQYLNKPAEQLKIAEAMLTTGEMPDFLQGHENQVTFRLDLRNEGDQQNLIVQARAARDVNDIEYMITQLTTGKPLPAYDPLEGQLRRFKSIMRTHFPNHLRSNNFEPLKSDK